MSDDKLRADNHTRALAQKIEEAAAFLDRMAEQMERWTRPPGASEVAADCRAMANKLRSET